MPDSSWSQASLVQEKPQANNQSQTLNISSGSHCFCGDDLMSIFTLGLIIAAFITPWVQEKKKENRRQQTSAVEENVLQSWTEARIEVAALWPEEGAAETLLEGRVDGGDPEGEEQECKWRNTAEHLQWKIFTLDFCVGGAGDVDSLEQYLYKCRCVDPGSVLKK